MPKDIALHSHRYENLKPNPIEVNINEFEIHDCRRIKTKT
jgi:hypothetical protein